MRRKAKHRFPPSLLELETRLNISVTMNYVGQTNLVDLVGTSSPGPDGFADGEIDLSNLSGTPISSVVLHASGAGGASWSTAANNLAISDPSPYTSAKVYFPVYANMVDPATWFDVFTITYSGSQTPIPVLGAGSSSGQGGFAADPSVYASTRAAGEQLEITSIVTNQPDLTSFSPDPGGDGNRDVVINFKNFTVNTTVPSDNPMYATLRATNPQNPSQVFGWTSAQVNSTYAYQGLATFGGTTGQFDFSPPPTVDLSTFDVQLVLVYGSSGSATNQTEEYPELATELGKSEPFGQSTQPSIPDTSITGFTPFVNVAAGAVPITATWIGQISQSRDGAPAGDVEIELSGLPTSEFLESSTLSNSTERSWYYQGPGAPASQQGQGSMIGSQQASSAVAFLFFQPNLNDNGTTLTIEVHFQNSYQGGKDGYVQLQAGTDNPNYVTGITYYPVSISPTNLPSGVDLGGLLNNPSAYYSKYGIPTGDYPQFNIQNAVYTIAEPVVINAPMVVSSQGATLQFTSTALATGAQQAIQIASSHVHLDGFTVDFGTQSPSWSYNPVGDATRSMVGIYSTLSSYEYLDDDSISNLIINLPASVNPGGSSYNFSTGVDAIRTGRYGSGTIDGNTISGAGITVMDGPWTIEGNTYLGALLPSSGYATHTVTQALYLSYDAHDLTVENNRFAQLSPSTSAQTIRFITQIGNASSQDNIAVSGNYVTGIGNQQSGSKTPEFILTNTDFVAFQGVPLLLSSDGREFQVDNVLTDGGILSPNSVVTIVNGANAGKAYYKIAQQIILSSGGFVIVMVDPLPTFGGYIIQISDGTVAEQITSNTFDMSQDDPGDPVLDLESNNYGFTFNDNTVISDGRGGAGMAVAGHGAEEGNDGSVEAPNFWTISPVIGLNIMGNVFIDAGVAEFFDENSTPPLDASPGYIYFSATVENNTFQYDQSFLESHANPFAALQFGNGPFDSSSEYTLTLGANDYLVPSGASETVEALQNPNEPSQKITPFSAAPASTTLTISQDATNTKLDVSWAPVSGATSYELQRTTDPNGQYGWTVAGAAVTQTSYVDSGLSPSTEYWYRVRAVSSSGFSVNSPLAQATTRANTTSPPQLTVVSLSSPGQIQLSWTSYSGATSYVVLRSTDDVNFLIAATPSASPFTDSGLAASTTYYYYVNALTQAAPSADSNIASATTASTQITNPKAVSVGQDDSDQIGVGSSSSGPDGLQDLHFKLSNLPMTKTVSSIELVDQTGEQWWYGGSGGTDKAVLSRSNGASTGDLYIQPDHSEAGAVFTISITYTDSSTSPAIQVSGVYADAGLVDATATSYGQDNKDYYGPSSSSTGPDGFQDIHLVLSGLPSYLSITYVDVLGNGGGEWRYGGSPGTSKAALIRASGANTADLFLPPYQTETGRFYTVSITYSNGTTVSSLYTNPIYADYNLPMTSGVSYNQDGEDYASLSSSKVGDGFQDVHIVLSNLPTHMAIDHVVVNSLGGGSLYLSDGSSGSWTTVVNRKGSSGVYSSTADVFFQPSQDDVNYPYQVTVYFAGATGDTEPTSFFVNVTCTANLPMPSIVSYNQDGSDYARQAPTAGSDGLQDVHLLLSNLPTHDPIQRVDVERLGGGGSYTSTGANGTWMAVVQQSSTGTNDWSSSADVYFQPDQTDSNQSYSITIYFQGESGDPFTITLWTNVWSINNLPNLTVTDVGQTGADYASLSATAQADGYQDEQLVISNLPSYMSISTAVLTRNGGGATYLSDGSPNSWSTVVQQPLISAGVYSSTAYVFFQPRFDDVSQLYQIQFFYKAPGTPPVIGSTVQYFNGSGVPDLPDPTTLYTDTFSSTTINSAWHVLGGTWSDNGSVLQQTNNGNINNKIIRLNNFTNFPSSAQIVAEVIPTDTWGTGDDSRVGVGLNTDTSGNGFYLLFHGTNQVQLLDGNIQWSSAVPFTWSVNTTYWFKLMVVENPSNGQSSLYGKVWANGSMEPSTWTISQTGWTWAAGEPALDGGASGSGTANFDNVTITSNVLFQDAFNTGSISSAWTVVGGTWAVNSSTGEVVQSSTSSSTKQLHVTTPSTVPTSAQIMALVDVTNWSTDDSRVGVGLDSTSSAGGFYLVFHGTNQVQFLDGNVSWSGGVSFAWSLNTPYWFKLQAVKDPTTGNSTLYGKIWPANGSAEPTVWTITQSGWSLPAGAPALEGGSAGVATSIFDDVSVSYVLPPSSGGNYTFALIHNPGVPIATNQGSPGISTVPVVPLVPPVALSADEGESPPTTPPPAPSPIRMSIRRFYERRRFEQRISEGKHRVAQRWMASERRIAGAADRSELDSLTKRPAPPFEAAGFRDS